MPTLTRVLPNQTTLPLYGDAACRALEQAAAAALAPNTLMQRAGLSLARLALAIAPHAQSIWVAAGPGNNGGDGVVAARWLQAAGKRVYLSRQAGQGPVPADTAVALAQARAAGLVAHEHAPPIDATFDLAIDALLGLGLQRPVEGALADTITQLNQLRCPVLAVDVPSGLQSQTGQSSGGAWVRAQHTMCLLSLKPGLFTGTGREACNTIWFDPLLTETLAAPDAWLLGANCQSPWQGPRRASQHKGSFGDVIVIGGAPGMVGAAVLAARSAHAAGAGRVYLCALDPHAPSLADPTRPELMHIAKDQALTEAQLSTRTVVCGCGGGQKVGQVLPALLTNAARLVLDADALNAIAHDPSLQAQLTARAAWGFNTVLTPHPLEAARLLGRSVAEVQADRIAAARTLSERFACVLVLKGSGTVIAVPGKTPAINSSGNAALATAGTGDVLAGWLGGLWAQRPGSGLDDAGWDAACAACHAHGAAADHWPLALLPAADLVEAMRAGHP